MARRPSHQRRRALGLAAAAGAALAVVWLGAAGAIRLTHRGEVLPGTRVAGIDLGGSDLAQARRKLSKLPAPARSVVLVAAQRRFTVSSADVGLRVDADRSARRALRAGRGTADFVAVPAGVLGAERAVPVAYATRPRDMSRAVARIAAAVDRPAAVGALAVSAAGVRARPGALTPGRVVDRAALARTIVAALAGGRAGAAIPLRRDAPPSAAALERVAQRARDYLAGLPLRLVGAGRPVLLEEADLVPILTVGRRPSGRIGLDADPRATARLAARVAAQRRRPARDARLAAAAAPVTLDEKGDVGWRPRAASVRVTPARPGRVVAADETAAAIAAAVRSGRFEVSLPVRPLAPRIATTAARRVRSLIGTFTTYFPCCAPRVTNIRLIARAVDGTVIAPGERFSLNTVAGERTRARGFVAAPFISDGELVQSVGGGVSQFSTTMYNAAYFAGLHIEAHQAHSFYIDRYPPGREATLDYGTIDLVWANDTSAPVLVRTASTGTSVTVSLYGANGGRRVRATVGPRRPVPGRDFAITVTRTIRYGDGRVVREPLTTTYDVPPAE